MPTRSIDDSQRKAARVAAVANLLAMAIVVTANFAIQNRLIVRGDAAETARNIMAHEQLFRLNIVCDLVYTAGIVVLLSALYVILRPVGRTLALVGAFLRLTYALIWGVGALSLMAVLRALGDADYLRAYHPEQLQALARLYLRAGSDAYYIGLPFYALASTIVGWLWFRSRYIPKALAAFGVTASAWCVFCAFAYIISPGFARIVNLWWFDSPMAVFELVTSFWLLFRGLRSGTAAPGEAGDRATSVAAPAI